MVEELRQPATIFCNQVECHPYKAQDDLVEQAKRIGCLLIAFIQSRRKSGLPERCETLEELAEAPR